MVKKWIVLGTVALAVACTPKEKKNEEVNTTNPLLSEYTTSFGVPPFEQVKLEHYMPAFHQGMEEQKAEIDVIIRQRSMPDFENTIVALDQSGKLLRRVSALFYGLNSADTNDEMQALSKELSPLLSAHNDDINLNSLLFARVKQVYERREDFNLDKEQNKLLEETYKNFVRGGANLDTSAQIRLRELNSEIALLQLTFGQNMLKETNAFRLVVDNIDNLEGLSKGIIDNAAAEAKDDNEKDKWVFTLHNPSVMPFLSYADNRELRKQLFEAYIMRGNNGNDADNKEIVKQLVNLRLEKAKLMGYADFASFVLEDRMAKNNESVYKLLNDVWGPADKKAKEELADIQSEMKRAGIKEEAQGWDWRYYAEKAKKARFDFDENEIRPYLELGNVCQGMFGVANKLFGITFTELTDIPKPHAEAVAYECRDKDSTHLGILYLDYFPRPSKRGGAWCGTYRAQTYADGERVAPVVTIVCNFTKPSGDLPALLTVDEASTLFHEFGHALHNLFKDVHYYGISGVPRDFVELPSQIMEHWTFEPEVLKTYAFHYETGEVIPTALIEKLEKVGKYGQGFATMEYLAASVLDMDYHIVKTEQPTLDVNEFEKASLGKRGLLKQIPPRYRSTYFNHIMGGGYTAGYYSYLWAEVLDADAYQAFVEKGDIFHNETAEKFRKFILTPGGIDDAMDMYKNFRGKEPNIEPLLKNRGLK